MSFIFSPQSVTCLDALDEQVRRSPDCTREFFERAFGQHSAGIRESCQATTISRINQLIEADAWLDAALALIDVKLPGWTLRRIVYEDGRWLCTLSRHAALPREFDDTAEADHEVLPLAILLAYLEACRRSRASGAIESTVPQIRPDATVPICCDDFA
jgi:hypothetical protein